MTAFLKKYKTVIKSAYFYKKKEVVILLKSYYTLWRGDISLKDKGNELKKKITTPDQFARK